MSHVYADRVREIATTTGTGTFALGGEKVNYIPFSDVCGNNDTVHYCIALAKTLEWEVGIGTWKTGGLLERTTILSSSNNNLIVDFSAGVKDVYMVNPASQIESYAKHRDTRPYKSLWEYIPSTLWDSIVAETITTDLKTYIQDAIDDGYPIVAPNGLYPMASAIKLKTGTSIRSLGASGGAIFQAKSTMTAPVLFDVNDLSDGTDVWAQSNILLDGITLDGQSRTISSDAALLRFYSVDGLTLRDCTFKNQLYSLVALGGCRDVSLSGLRFRNWGKTAVTAEGGPGLWIGGNTVGGDDTVSSRIRGYDLDFSGGEWAAVYDFSSDSEFFGVNIEDVKESGFYYQGNWSGNTAVDGQPRRHLYSGFNIKGVTRKNISSAGLEIAGDSCIVTNFNISDTEDAGLKIEMLSRNVSVSQGHIWDTVLAGDSGHPNYFATYATYGQIQLIQAEDIVNHDVSITGVTVGRTDVAAVADYALRISNSNPTPTLYWQHLSITGNNFTHGYSVSAISVQSGAIDPADTTSAICDNIGAADVSMPFPVRRDYDIGGYDLVNSVENPRFERGDHGWAYVSGQWSINSDSTNAYSGHYVAVCSDTSGVQRAFDSNYSDCEVGDVIYAEMWLKTSVGITATNMRVQVLWYDKDKAFLSSSSGTNYTTDQLAYVLSTVTATAPANACYFKVRALAQKTAGTLYVDSIFGFRKRDASKLVSDATVGNTQLATMAQATFKMRAAGAGTGAPIDGTAAQAKTALAIAAADITDATTAGKNLLTAADVNAQLVLLNFWGRQIAVPMMLQ